MFFCLIVLYILIVPTQFTLAPLFLPPPSVYLTAHRLHPASLAPTCYPHTPPPPPPPSPPPVHPCQFTTTADHPPPPYVWTQGQGYLLVDWLILGRALVIDNPQLTAPSVKKKLKGLTLRHGVL